MKAIFLHTTSLILFLLIVGSSQKTQAQTASCGDIAAGTLQFETKKSSLTPEIMKKLDVLAGQMRGNSCKVVILGNGGGSKKWNETRMDRVIEYMSKKGIEGARFEKQVDGSAREYSIVYHVADSK